MVEGTRAGTVLIGASRERVGFDPSLSVEALALLARQAVRLFPFLRDVRLLRAYAGFRPYCPDHLPVIGPDPRVPGLLHACGHEGAGIGLAPATGRLVADLVTGCGTAPRPGAVRPAPTRTGADMSDFDFDGRTIDFVEGQSVGAALTAAGIRSWRTTREARPPARALLRHRHLLRLPGGGRRPPEPARLPGARPGGRRGDEPGRDRSWRPRGLSRTTCWWSAAARPGSRRPQRRSAPGSGSRWSTPGRDRVASTGASPRTPSAPASARSAPTSSTTATSYERLVGEAAGADWHAEHEVWAITPAADGFDVHTVVQAGAVDARSTLPARRLVLAPGAYDRQLPFPGWDLPGVMTAGGVQALLRGHGVAAGARVLVAGTGPFLLPVAAGLAAAGARVVGVHEAASGAGWVRHPLAVARNPGTVALGLGLARALARHRIPVRRRSVVVAAHGDDAVTAVTVGRLRPDGRVVAGSERRVPTDLVAIGWGFTPQLELPLALGCATRVDADGSPVCAVGDEQQSSVEGVWVAGEACGVGGAALAVVEGAIAGAAAAGLAVPSAPARRRRSAARAFAAALHRSHPVPPGWVDRVTDDTLVCRCEEVTAGALRSAVDALGADSARSAKLLVRTGMGWCQGRVCGYATSCLVAARTGGLPSAPLPERPIAAPLTLGALADDG